MTANDANSNAHDILWISPIYSASCSACMMTIMTPIDMNGELRHGSLIFGDVHLIDPICVTSATTAVHEVHIDGVRLVNTVMSTGCVSANRDQAAVCLFCFCVCLCFGVLVGFDARKPKRASAVGLRLLLCFCFSDVVFLYVCGRLCERLCVCWMFVAVRQRECGW